MHPELFKLPFIDLTVKSYGLMVVLGFFAAIFVVKKMCKRTSQDYETLINAAFYSFIIGIIGSRVFHIIHYYENFDNIWQMLAIWKGGLELLGGVIPAIIFLIYYLKVKKVDVPLSLDIFATALMVGIAFGRIGCFLNGCCFGMATECPVSVQFPYNSIPYQAQAYPDIDRNRQEPIIELPAEYYGYFDRQDNWQQAPEGTKHLYMLKPADRLTEEQAEKVNDEYSCKPVHPTQLYSSFAAMINFGILTVFWGRWGSGQPARRKQKFRQGTTAALMLITYSIFRFAIESLRGDNPYEIASLTASQLLSIGMFVCGMVLFAGFSQGMKSKK